MNVLSRVSYGAPDNIYIMFLIAPPFNLTPPLVGVFLGYKMLVLAGVCVVYSAVPALKTRTDTQLTLTGQVSLLLSYLALLLATSRTLLFVGATLHGAMGLSNVGLSSLLTKTTSPTQLAQSLATVGAVERLLKCLVTIVLCVLFHWTKAWSLPGTCFALPLLLTTLSLLLASGYFMSRTYQPSDNVLRTVIILP